ncbi:hypothetical protein KCV07_g27, partial [Aureobasidium melanogenum]
MIPQIGKCNALEASRTRSAIGRGQGWETQKGPPDDFLMAACQIKYSSDVACLLRSDLARCSNAFTTTAKGVSSAEALLRIASRSSLEDLGQGWPYRT